MQQKKWKSGKLFLKASNRSSNIEVGNCQLNKSSGWMDVVAVLRLFTAINLTGSKIAIRVFVLRVILVRIVITLIFVVMFILATMVTLVLWFFVFDGF